MELVTLVNPSGPSEQVAVMPEGDRLPNEIKWKGHLFVRQGDSRVYVLLDES